ncbi:EF hand [Maioricimonas rarisocia]|uniref:EF hand n=1 Tax=Maioricimonas rarisocia TaxID=2528026 RepID=A0A517Z4Q8_9PLAN|nr:hypothetical protein [Maioricimonas rarisocia]QDU37464.1 EF hand [Maioricimonas rarisocia]
MFTVRSRLVLAMAWLGISACGLRGPALAQEDSDVTSTSDRFAACDMNADGVVTLPELKEQHPEERHPALERDYRVVDWDQNGQLSREEYFAIPGMRPGEERTGVPDPIAEMCAERIEFIRQQWDAWDRNGDNVLDEAETESAGLNSIVPGATDVEYETWDRDGERGISQEEAVNLLEVAYGVRSWAGMLLRRDNGHVFNSMGFRYQDADRDGVIGSEDTQVRRKMDAEAAGELIARFDRDEDGTLDAEEAWGISREDILSRFLDADMDLNGLLSEAELLEAAPDYRRGIAAFVFPGFDRDRDGELNFMEYRSCPLANYDEAWHEARHRRQDLDDDGQLSFEEFTWGRELESCAVRAFLFERLDTNGDERLDLTEFEFHVIPGRVPVHVAFVYRDQNRDGALSLQELLNGEAEEKQPRLARDFGVVDWNGDESLSEDEYRAITSLVSLEQRAAIPDPVVELADESLAQIRQQWSGWDVDGNGTLEEAEFGESGLGDAISGLEGVEFRDWDLDDEGELTQDEVVRVVEAAFGVRRMDGLSLREPTGRVFSWMAFRWQDVDGDDAISVEEMTEKRKLDRDTAEAEIAKFDQNGDGRLSPEEAWQVLHFDPLAMFMRADTDLDGKLSREELLASTPGYQQLVATFVLPAFDSDGDGLLSFREFRLCPIANFHEAWHEQRRDSDDDGFLSPADFSWGRTIDGAAMVAFMFHSLDTSGDGQLDLDEWHFHTSFRDPERDFQAADANDDGVLTLDEFISPERDAAVERRDFAVFDADGDGALTEREYRSIPSRTALSQRIAAPDPVGELAERMVTQLEQTFAAAESDGDGRLTGEEFRNGRLTRDVPGLQLSGYRDWNLNQDDGVTFDEIQRVVYAAYGIWRLDGLPYREPSGVIHNSMNFRFADEDGDDRVSREEYLERGFGGTTAEEKFASADANGDSMLDFAEWSAAPHWIVDPVAQFLKYDTDLSGGLSHEEIMAGTPEWQHLMTERYLAAFDDDGDDVLSLTEYRRVPMANMLASWHSRRTDRDGDGHLSFSEFHDLEGVELVSLAQEYFRRLDSDGDGKLALRDLDFYIDPARVPATIAFEYSDANGDHALVLDELLVNYKGRTDRGAQSMIGRIEEAFLAADAGGDQKLSREEFGKYREIMNGSHRRGAGAAGAQVAGVAEGDSAEADFRFWLLITFNVLLVAGVGWYAIAKT